MVYQEKIFMCCNVCLAQMPSIKVKVLTTTRNKRRFDGTLVFACTAVTNESEIVAVEGTADQLGSPKFTKDTFVYISNYRPGVCNGRKIIRLLTASKVIIFNIEHTIHNTISAILVLPYWYTGSTFIS